MLDTITLFSFWQDKENSYRHICLVALFNKVACSHSFQSNEFFVECYVINIISNYILYRGPPGESGKEGQAGPPGIMGHPGLYFLMKTFLSSVF